MLGGFLLLQSMAGGTGAGLGTYVAQVRGGVTAAAGGGRPHPLDERKGVRESGGGRRVCLSLDTESEGESK